MFIGFNTRIDSNKDVFAMTVFLILASLVLALIVKDLIPRLVPYWPTIVLVTASMIYFVINFAELNAYLIGYQMFMFSK